MQWFKQNIILTVKFLKEWSVWLNSRLLANTLSLKADEKFGTSWPDSEKEIKNLYDQRSEPNRAIDKSSKEA